MLHKSIFQSNRITVSYNGSVLFQVLWDAICGLDMVHGWYSSVQDDCDDTVAMGGQAFYWESLSRQRRIAVLATAPTISLYPGLKMLTGKGTVSCLKVFCKPS